MLIALTMAAPALANEAVAAPLAFEKPRIALGGIGFTVEEGMASNKDPNLFTDIPTGAVANLHVYVYQWVLGDDLPFLGEGVIFTDVKISAYLDNEWVEIWQAEINSRTRRMDWFIEYVKPNQFNVPLKAEVGYDSRTMLFPWLFYDHADISVQGPTN